MKSRREENEDVVHRWMEHGHHLDHQLTQG